MKKYKVYFWHRIPRKIFKPIKEKYKARLKDYMNIYVCENFDEMYNLCDKLEKTELKRDYAGRTYCFSKNFYVIETGEYVKTSPCCGYIALNEKYFWMDSITHESTHAVIGYFNRKLKDYQNVFVEMDKDGNILSGVEDELNEELFCYMVGNLADQIVAKYDKIKEEVK